jgi:cytochrome P450
MILAGFDPEFVSENPDQVVTDLLGAGQALADLVTSLGVERAQAPAGDLISALVTANVDGEQLTGAELASFFVLLVVAGNETTRNALSHALMLFTDFPEQRALLLADIDGRIGGAVEEIIRYASPVMFMRRSLTRDYTMNGQDYREGDKAVLFYYSANRDEAVFRDPERFDITRSPNPHVGFGGANLTGCCPASSTASNGCRATSPAEIYRSNPIPYIDPYITLRPRGRPSMLTDFTAEDGCDAGRHPFDLRRQPAGQARRHRRPAGRDRRDVDLRRARGAVEPGGEPAA